MDGSGIYLEMMNMDCPGICYDLKHMNMGSPETQWEVGSAIKEHTRAAMGSLIK